MKAIFSVTFHAYARIGEMVFCSNGQSQHAILAHDVVIGPGLVAVSFISFKYHRGEAAGSVLGGMHSQTTDRECDH